MVSTAVLLLVLASQAQPEPKIAATLQDVPGGKDKRASFLLEGTAGYPDGARLEVNLFFEHADGRHLARTVLQVVDGKFSGPVEVPWERNVAGTYVCRVEFDPNLQPGGLGRLPRKRLDLEHQLGSVVDAQNEKRQWREKLHGELKAMIAMVEQIEALMKETKDKPNPQAWKTRIPAWTEELAALQKRAFTTVAYKLYGDLCYIAEDGVHRMREYVELLAQLASQGNEKAVRQGHERIYQTVAGYEQILTKKEYSAKDILDLAREARKLIKESPALEGDALADAKGRLKLTLLALGGSVSGAAREAVMAVVSGTPDFFAAIEAKSDKVKAIQEGLDLKMEDLLEALESKQ